MFYTIDISAIIGFINMLRGDAAWIKVERLIAKSTIQHATRNNIRSQEGSDEDDN